NRHHGGHGHAGHWSSWPWPPRAWSLVPWSLVLGQWPLATKDQSRLGPGLFRSRRSLSALKRRISSSSALFFSSRMVMRVFGSSPPRNFSSALPTSSFFVMIQCSPFVDRCGPQSPDGRGEVYFNSRQIGQWHLEAPQHG